MRFRFDILIASLIGAGLIGHYFDSFEFGLGVWLLTYSVMPYVPKE